LHRLMDLLRITELRRGAYGRNMQAPNGANYDESKANPYPDLPNPLVLRNGVTSAKIWWTRRRPQTHSTSELGRDQDYQRMKWRYTGRHETTGRSCRQFLVPANHRGHPALADRPSERSRTRAGDHGIR